MDSRANITPTLLVTGANGVVGGRLCEEALAKGYHVVAAIRPKGEDGTVIPTRELRMLKMKYRDVLHIVPLELPDAAQCQSIFDAHPEITHVVHAAGLSGGYDISAADKIDAVNREGTIVLAQAANTHAKNTQQHVPFHFISSVEALRYADNPDQILEIPGRCYRTYAKSKFEASEWLKQHGSGLPQLDISISYPSALLARKPKVNLAGNMLSKANKMENLVEAYTAGQLYSETNRSRALAFTGLGNFIRDVFAAIEAPPSKGVKEYGIEIDHHLTLGEFADTIAEVADEFFAHPDYETARSLPDVSLKDTPKPMPTARFIYPDLPSPPNAPPHEKTSIYDVLVAQCANVSGRVLS
jgi:nucleoside-diphosphate-sugar epimerase